MNLLAIDQGTSGTKAVVWSPDGGLVSEAEVPLRPTYLGDGGVEQDPDALLGSVLTAGREAVRSAGVPIAAVALANQGETVLAWDEASGRPLSPAIVWQDRRSQSVCDELHERREQLTQQTGLELDPYFSAPKMAWLRRHVTTDGVVTTSDTWLVHQLTGEFVTDRSTASRSMLLPLGARDFDPDLMALFGLASEKSPTIVASDQVVGTTSAFSTSTLDSEIPVAGLIVDQPAALFAEGCLQPGMAKCTYGTGAFLLANVGPDATTVPGGLTTSVAWEARDQIAHCVDGQVYTAASAVRWMQDLRLIDGPADLDRVARPDAGDVLCVPALAGLAAPWWRADTNAVITGMSLATERGHIVTAVLQGIAAQVAEIMDRVTGAIGQPIARLRVDGGLTRSAALMQAQADISQVPVDVFPSPNATALGAAALANLAIQPDLEPNHALGAWTPVATYEPRWSADRAGQFLDSWRRLVDDTLTRQDNS